ncbi:MAG: hypothetical protein H0V09_01255 [Gemmatimonadetes bacterium]|nr:hypothetical protein [Gemmatimonadota bacterium]
MPRMTACAVLLLTLLGGRSARAQHSPRLAQAPELGAELILGDDLTSLAGVFLTRFGRQTDIRFGAGAADPDDSDTDGFVRTGLRAFVSPRSRSLPFDVAVEGQLDVFFGQDNTVSLRGGPSFGRTGGREGALVAYAQPLFLYMHEVGQSDVKLGVRVGADYRMGRTADLRGDLLLSSAMELRAALYLRPGELLK